MKKALIRQGMYREQENNHRGTSLVAQWLRLHASTAGQPEVSPRSGTKILHAMGNNQNTKKKKIAILSGLTIQEGRHLDLPEILNTMNEG